MRTRRSLRAVGAGVAVGGLLASMATAAVAEGPGGETSIRATGGTVTAQQIHVQAAGLEAYSATETFARLGTTFADAPAALLRDADGAPVAGAPVTFGISGDATFEPGPDPAERERTVLTDWRGVATAPRVIAGESRGTSVVVASAVDSAGTVSFDYVTTGTPTVVETSPAGQLVMGPGEHARFDVTLRDDQGLPVGGEVVTGTLVGAPEGVVWPGGFDTLELRTDADGVIRFGEQGDGTDTFTVTTEAPYGRSFTLLLLTRAPGGIAHQVPVLIEINAG